MYYWTHSNDCSIILKKSNFGPNVTFWPPWGLGKSFPKGNIYSRKCLINVWLHAKNKKKRVTRFRRYFLKSQFWAQNLTFWPLEGLGKSFPEENIHIVWNALLLSNFMQKIKKFWPAVQKQSLRKSNFGPNLTFWPRSQGSRAFFENWKTSFFYIYAVLTLCKISRNSGTRILRYQRYRWTDRRTDGRTNRRTKLNL